jgi:sigma-B regulation protein RsbU (phosphoserine phosphatase)
MSVDDPTAAAADAAAGPPTEETWHDRLAHIIDTMRSISLETEPAALVMEYRQRMARVLVMDRMLSLTRRGVEYPAVIIARDSWKDQDIDPWKDRDKLPVIRGGLLAELLYGHDERIVFHDFDFPQDDPAAHYFEGMRSFVALPVFDSGQAFNRVIFMIRDPAGFDLQTLPQMALATNLLGRVTHSLALTNQLRKMNDDLSIAHQNLKRAHDQLDEEMRLIADIQRSLLPAQLPDIPTLQLAAHYQPATRAGGDYYDFFQCQDGRWGILIADVAGHGSPAAVLMAVTHSLMHSHPEPNASPSQMLAYINKHLSARYTTDNGKFVTAWIGLYDPATRQLQYASAGHPPPRVRDCDSAVWTLDQARGLPLGIIPDATFQQATVQLTVGQRLVLYTDGITETMDPTNDLFGSRRLDEALTDCGATASDIVTRVIESVNRFGEGRDVEDDRTLVAIRIVA